MLLPDLVRALTRKLRLAQARAVAAEQTTAHYQHLLLRTLALYPVLPAAPPTALVARIQRSLAIQANPQRVRYPVAQ